MTSPATRVLFVLALASACAGRTAVLREPSGDPASAIRAARELGATRSVEAGLFLRLATEELASAEALTGPQQAGRADDLRRRARVDADLASALARQAAAKAAADDARYEERISRDDPGE
jgi:hypothetical protein